MANTERPRERLSEENRQVQAQLRQLGANLRRANGDPPPDDLPDDLAQKLEELADRIDE